MLYVSKYFIILNCHIHHGGNENDGIVFSNVTNGIIKYNIITGNRNGIDFLPRNPGEQDSSKNEISFNSIIYNLHSGILFSHSMDNHQQNKILYNNISNNRVGIYMITSHRNEIIYNNISLNKKFGIFLDMCEGGGEYNRVHHNNFIINNNNSYYQNANSGGENYWNENYPSGGNFWSNYIGEDEYSGVNQNKTGDDGIGDKPYNITDSGIHDLYPLMNPVIIKVDWPTTPIHVNIPPIANFTYSPTNITVNDIVKFTDLSIDNNGTIISWYWDFGDNHTSIESNPTHSFKEVGNYTIILKVTDNNNISNKSSQIIYVHLDTSKSKDIHFIIFLSVIMVILILLIFTINYWYPLKN